MSKALRSAACFAVLAALSLGAAWSAAASPQSLEDWRARLASHPVLGKLVMVVNKAHEPVTILVNEPQPRTRQGFETPVTDLHGPWFVAMRRLFGRRYAEPFNLTRREGRELDPIVILWQLSDYAPYAKAVKDPGCFNAEGAHFDSELGAVVSFEYGAMNAAPHWKRWPMLSCYVQSLLDAHKRSPAVKIPFVVGEGLGSYLGLVISTTTDSLDEPRKPDARTFEKQVRMAHDAGMRRMMTLGIDDLFEPTTLAGARQQIIDRVGVAAAKLVKEKDQFEHLHYQAWTFVHFMHEGAGGKYRKGFDAYVKSVLEGDPSAAAFRRSIGGVDLAVVENEYYAWMFDTARSIIPNFKPDERALPGGGKVDPAEASKAVAEKSVSLALGADEIEAELASKLIDARSGKLELTVLALEELRGRPKAGPLAERIDRELMRVRKLLLARDAHMGEVLKSGKFVYEHDGKKTTLKVRSLGDGKLFFEDNRLDISELAVNSLDVYELSKQFSKTITGGPDGWAKAYAYILAGDDKGKRMLKGDEAHIQQLEQDAESWYPGALKLGAAANELTSLTAKGVPGDAASAKTVVASIEALMKEHGELEIVRKRAPALRTLAELALEKLYQPSNASETTAAKVETLDGGRVRLTYVFDKKAEFDDFAPDHDYFKSWRGGLQGRTVAPTPEAAVDRGSLRMRGAACLRHTWQFSVPVKVSYEVGFEGLNEDESRTPLFAVGALDDRAENFVWCQGFGSLYANYGPRRWVVSDPVTSNRAIEDGSYTRLELSIDGGKIVTRESGELVKEAADAPHLTGGVFLYVHTDPIVVFEKLVIEGVPDQPAIVRAWIAKRVSQLGL